MNRIHENTGSDAQENIDDMYRVMCDLNDEVQTNHRKQLIQKSDLLRKLISIRNHTGAYENMKHLIKHKGRNVDRFLIIDNIMKRYELYECIQV